MTRTAQEMRAQAAADGLEAARSVGRQMSLLPAEATPADPAELEPRGPGRPAGSRNRRTSKLRAMLAARGFRMPEDVVAEVAGLGARDRTMVELAMDRAEQVAAWLEERTGGVPLKRDQLLGIFTTIWKEQVAAAATLLPYGLEKLSPETAVVAPVAIVLPGVQAARPGDQARVIEAQASDMAPPPLPGEIVRNQWLTDAEPVASDGSGRTE